MKRIKYVLLILLVLLTINVKAEENCEKSELTRLKELAKKVEFDYDYKLIDDKANFSITAYNLNEDLKVMIIDDYYLDKYRLFDDNSNHKNTINNFESGEKVIITIKAFVPNWCSGETLLTKTIKLPYYNKFYNEEKCLGLEDFKYCKKLIDSDINETQFDEQYNEFLKTKVVEEEEKIAKKSNWTLIIIIGSIVVALMILVGITMIIVRKRRRNSL